MENYIERLERLRKKEGKKKADMARLMKANSLQQYNNWVYRNALPEEKIPQAIEVLQKGGEEIELESEILRRIQLLPPTKAKIVLSLIDELTSPEGD